MLCDSIRGQHLACTVQAVAYADGLTNSSVTAATYTIQ